MTFDPASEVATMNGSPKKTTKTKQPEPAAAVESQSSVIIEVPMGELSKGYITTRFEVTSLTVEQANALNQLTTGLREKNARCQRRDARTPYGIVVDREIDAIRWLLDQVAVGSIGSL